MSRSGFCLPASTLRILMWMTPLASPFAALYPCTERGVRSAMSDGGGGLHTFSRTAPTANDDATQNAQTEQCLEIALATRQPASP